MAHLSGDRLVELWLPLTLAPSPAVTSLEQSLQSLGMPGDTQELRDSM